MIELFRKRIRLCARARNHRDRLIALFAITRKRFFQELLRILAHNRRFPAASNRIYAVRAEYFCAEIRNRQCRTIAFRQPVDRCVFRAEAHPPRIRIARRHSGRRALHRITQKRNRRVRQILAQQHQRRFRIILCFVHKQMADRSIGLYKSQPHTQIRLCNRILPPCEICPIVLVIRVAQRFRRILHRVDEQFFAGNLQHRAQAQANGLKLLAGRHSTHVFELSSGIFSLISALILLIEPLAEAFHARIQPRTHMLQPLARGEYAGFARVHLAKLLCGNIDLSVQQHVAEFRAVLRKCIAEALQFARKQPARLPFHRLNAQRITVPEQLFRLMYRRFRSSPDDFAHHFIECARADIFLAQLRKNR